MPPFETVDPQRLLALVLSIPFFMLSLTIHEFAHAWMAKRFGDRTAEEQGRLSFDPRVHIDPLGALCFLLSALSGFGFGWAKPVPFNLANCREPLNARFWIALAGPLSNVLQALVALPVLAILALCGAHAGFALLGGVRLITEQTGLSPLDVVACLVGYYLAINLILAWFNLLPVPPLDGHHLVMATARHEVVRVYAMLQQYGFVILLGLMFCGALDYWFKPLLWLLTHLAFVLEPALQAQL